jgi:hypothetical protein
MTSAAGVVVTHETPLTAKCIEDPSPATSPSKAIAMATTVAVLRTPLTVEAVPSATDEELTTAFGVIVADGKFSFSCSEIRLSTNCTCPSGA